MNNYKRYIKRYLCGENEQEIFNKLNVLKEIFSDDCIFYINNISYSNESKLYNLNVYLQVGDSFRYFEEEFKTIKEILEHEIEELEYYS